MEFELIRSARRRQVAFRIGGNGSLTVLAPERLPLPEIERIVESNASRIDNWRRRAAASPPAPQRNFAEGELFPLFDQFYPLHLTSRLLLFDEAFLVVRGTPAEIRRQMEILYRRLALRHLREKCIFFGESTHLLPHSVGVTGAATRWGSCSSNRHISFCWKLMLVPEKLADYVVCHELAHLRELNHSPRFWELVGEMIPDYRERRAALKALPELW